MRCTSCGADLVLTQVVPDAATGVRGLEHHTFICSACHVTERRMLFMRHGREDDSEPMPTHEASPTVPVSKAQEQHAGASGLLSRVIARMRGHSAYR
jgi:hypothetical protein